MSIANTPPPHNGFDPDFASPAEWAALYRACGLQVIPGWMPGEVKGAWKRPKLADWVPLQNALAPDTTFDRWYNATTGENRSRPNMGLITGACSGRVFIVDLDTYKNPAAMQWWRGVLAVNNNDIEPETPRQRTGGGGLQIMFRAPPGWTPPTNRTPIGVDIRGQAGFAVLPPSLHDSGATYNWLPGCAPWEIPVMEAPDWLCAAIDELVGVAKPEAELPLPGAPAEPALRRIAEAADDFTAFGKRQDGREEYMATVVWAAVVDLYRESPIQPPQGQIHILSLRAYEAYERKVVTRYSDLEKRDGLEREGRGLTAFHVKWLAAMKHWNDRVASDAAKPKPAEDIWDTGAATPQLPPPQPVPVDPATGQPLPLLLTAKQFVDGFTPPAYLIDGMLQRGYLYSLTARTGHGKTAVAMYMMQTVARGIGMHGRETKQGTVLLLAGENPDDIRARFLVLAEVHHFKAEDLKIRVIAGVVDLPSMMANIEAEAALIDDLILVIVDTAAAYFPGDETNSNSQQGAYARLLRRLTFLKGKPTVLVACHPIKNASRENLLPMGGSAFVNEVDGNLTLWNTGDKQISMHWQGKFRGPEFEPCSFELRTADSARVIDAEGRLMPSVVAIPISEIIVEAGEQTREADENRLLRIMFAQPNASYSELATRMGFTSNNKPQKYRVQRIVEQLKADKMVEKHRGGKYRLTRKGEREIGEAGGQE